MEKIVRKFASHEEADKADAEYYRALTPEQRLEILFELVHREALARDPNYDPDKRSERVFRVVKREPR
jgi:hypothetical protein